MKINTSELSGVALDWAVAQAIGCKVNYCVHAECLLAEPMQWIDGCSFGGETAWMPTKKWTQCGPLMDSCNVDVQRYDYEQQPFTFAGLVHDSSEGGWQHIKEYGPTRMISICRAIAAAFIGDTVEVPDDLVGGED